MIWSEELTTKLRELADGKRTSEQLAALLGVTRNAVIGRAHRLGLKLSSHRNGFSSGRSKVKACARKKELAEMSASLPSLEVGTHLRRQGPSRTVVVPDPKPLALPPEPPAEPASRPCKLVALTATRCRWPLGDPRHKSFRYCGANKEVEVSYCHAHERIARMK